MELCEFFFETRKMKQLKKPVKVCLYVKSEIFQDREDSIAYNEKGKMIVLRGAVLEDGVSNLGLVFFVFFVSLVENEMLLFTVPQFFFMWVSNLGLVFFVFFVSLLEIYCFLSLPSHFF